ncbi:unnamed protein product [Rotaria sordida]|nr:unnamed protein product [Rotaria sordida]CAF1143004.1 unnamed protein product [Rotaria sordida]CAF1147450.1 unnamed protein product [Rotaria sordida]CAF3821538.1 unnamed protein product [Rotaria sordida]CAF3916844.1 unnamed protein product [Rotaria sordida]
MISNISLHIFTLFILFLIFANNYKILANNIYRRNDYVSPSLIFDNDQPKILFEPDNLFYESIDDEIPSSDYWSIIFRPNYIPPVPNTGSRRSINPSMPFKKRKIPLELQKALYAHGIVGRRR